MKILENFEHWWYRTGKYLILPKYHWRNFKNFCNSFYWFYIHKSMVLDYDESTHKHEIVKDAYRNENILYNWFEGETDIWNVMLRKVEQLFWMLKKNANQTYCYLWAGAITEFGTENDKLWALNKVLNSKEEKVWMGSKNEADEDGVIPNFYFYPKEQCVRTEKSYETNKVDTTCTEMKIKKFYILWNDSIKYYVADVNEKGEPIFFVSKNENVADKDLAKRFEEYPKELIENFDLTPESVYETDSKPVYRHVREVVAEYTGKAADDFIQKYKNEIIENAHSVEVEVSDFTKISKELKKHLVGAREQCKQLAHFHHLIIKATSISSFDEKYQPHISKEEEKEAEWKRVNDLYKSDRRTAYRAVADYLEEYGSSWWD